MVSARLKYLLALFLSLTKKLFSTGVCGLLAYSWFLVLVWVTGGHNASQVWNFPIAT